MNILVLNGSPKGERSNTIRLTHAFLDGAGWSDAVFVDISKTDVNACLGCFACWHATPGICVIKDDMKEILNQIIAADVIVWSFPLYYFSVPGTLKTLIDRQLPLNLPFMKADSDSGSHPARYDFKHQKHIVISTCGFWTAKGNYEAVTAMFDHICGSTNYTSIFCGQGELFRVPELKARTDAYLDCVRQAGTEYDMGCIQPTTQAELAQPLYPREVFEKMADASWGVSKNNDTVTPTDDSLSFTTQMAALYQPDGVERILELHYTDINKTYQIWLTKQGATMQTENFISYTTRIETPYALWCSVARGEISGQEALFQRLYKVLGDFNLMLKWDELFGGSTLVQKVQTKNRKANMLLLLAPWIIIWTAITFHPTFGSAASIAIAALIPMLWLVFKPVVYEQISIPIIVGLSLAALLGIPIRLILPASYFLFGFIWLASVCTKIPLTAYYSAAGYGSKNAYANPLFIRTNGILTGAWGMLYLITAVWTYLLMGTAFSPYVGLINSSLPLLLGAFTAWFQKWYPAWYARG